LNQLPTTDVPTICHSLAGANLSAFIIETKSAAAARVKYLLKRELLKLYRHSRSLGFWTLFYKFVPR